MRLIDADALLEYWEERKKPNYHENLGAYYQHIIMGNMIRNAPTIDAVPVVHGEWIAAHEEADGVQFTGERCSKCGWWKAMGIYNYCPNCGAKMDEKEDEDVHK